MEKFLSIWILSFVRNSILPSTLDDPILLCCLWHQRPKWLQLDWVNLSCSSHHQSWLHADYRVHPPQWRNQTLLLQNWVGEVAYCVVIFLLSVKNHTLSWTSMWMQERTLSFFSWCYHNFIPLNKGIFSLPFTLELMKSFLSYINLLKLP